MSGSMIKMSASTSKMPVAKMVMVRTKDVAPLLTCQICLKIQRNSTSIIECIHSFCKKCIIKKLTDEKLNSCPICNTDLGSTPLCKLRPDHNLQSLAARLFQSIKKNAKEPDVSAREAKKTVSAQEEDEEPETLTIRKPTRRKTRSLSSFVNTPNRKQLNISQPSKQQATCKDAGQNNVWDLNCLAEAVDTTKGGKSKSQGIVFKTPPSTRNTSNYIILDDDEEDPKPAPAPPVRISAQTVVDANANKNIGMNSVWLSLVATYRQDVGPPLPQIPCCYLRIKDIHSPVSVIKKYLVNKLDLESEDEVEIELLGRPVPSDMDIYMLGVMWGQAASERVSTSVGNSARDYVMVLSYSRKA